VKNFRKKWEGNRRKKKKKKYALSNQQLGKEPQGKRGKLEEEIQQEIPKKKERKPQSAVPHIRLSWGEQKRKNYFEQKERNRRNPRIHGKENN